MGKRKAFSKVISWLLVFAMVVTVLPSTSGTITVKADETDAITTMLTDLVQVQLGDETQTMQLYNQGVYECKFEFGAEEPAAESSFEKTVAQGGESTISESVSEDSIPADAAAVEDNEESDADESDDTAAPDEAATPVDAEEAAEATTVEKTATLLINGTKAAETTVEVGAEDIYFRLAGGKFTNSTDWAVGSVALVGNFEGIEFVDDAGERYDIASWKPADKNAKLDYIGGGFWARTFKFKELAADVTIADGGYKAAANEAWDISWGAGSGNVALTIPAGTSELKVVVDAANGVVYDSVNYPALEVATSDTNNPTITLTPFSSEDTVSLIGTARCDKNSDNDWKLTTEGYEFTQISDKWYLYQKTYAAGTYAWKLAYNHSVWSNFDDVKFTVANNDTNVIFLYDASTDKIYDSINNKTELGEMLNMATEAAAQEVIHNANDTFKFVCSPASAKTVDLVYGIYDSESKKVTNQTTVTLKANSDGSFTSNNIYFGDAQTTIAYYYDIDGAKKLDDSATATVEDEDDVTWSACEKAEFTGRYVSLPGTVSTAGWTPADPKIKLTYDGNGLYSITFKDVAAGNYEYKIAIDGSWDENYGASGEDHGANMKLTVSELSDVKFTYNDISHLTVNSIDYIFADIDLVGTGIPEGTKLTDDQLRGIYSTTVELKAGTYSDVKYVYDNKNYEVAEFELKSDKAVTFYFDPVTEIYYNDASDVKVNTNSIYYNSKDTVYKEPFGAIATDEKVRFTIQTGSDAKQVKLVIKGKARETLDMTEATVIADQADSTVSGNEIGTKLWSVEASFDKIGEYQYFFVISNGSSISVYSDDESKNYGEGMSTDLLHAVPYEFIVYQSGYETPDWMKNAVIYQIFPERFYNGDITNDTITSDARGDVQYEYVTDWYMLPENPDQEVTNEDKGINADNYPENAFSGDGNWSNEIYGGDLKGITERIDYLKNLGVKVIYLNPVFESISSHRYDTSDYKNIDPILGTLGDFDELVEIAKENDMKVVLDGVFNHVSDDSIYFDRYYEYLEEGTDTIGAYPYWAWVYDYMAANKKASQADAEKAAKSYFTSEYGITNYDYTEWFDVFTTTLKDDDGKEVCDNVGLRAGKPVYGYDGWWGYDSMPIIKATNGSEYQTGTWASEVIGKNETSTTPDDSVTQYWLSREMNGWRLDVANEVSDETWQHFRKSVKALDSDNVIIGEIWTDAAEYLLGDMYDSVMNYMFRNAATSFAKGGKASSSIDVLERLRERYPEEAFYAMMNLVDSHDTTRILSYLDGIDDDRNQTDLASAFPSYEDTSDLAKQRQYLVAFMQFTYAGAPTIYYGDEIGMVGADDPDDRRAMTWGKGNKDLVEWYATLAKIRNNNAVLRTGSVEVFTPEGSSDDVISYVRRDDTSAAIVMMTNKVDTTSNEGVAVTVTVDVNDIKVTGDSFTDLVSGNTYTAVDGKVTVTIPALRGVILVANGDQVTLTEDEASALKPAYDESYIVGEDEHAVKVTGVTLAKSALTLKKGETASVADGVTVAPSNATNKGVKWYTSNRSVAKVDTTTGKITAVGGGEATITVKTNDGAKVATCKVTVPGDAKPVVNQPKAVGTTATVTASKAKVKVTSADASNPTVEYTGTTQSTKTVKSVKIPATVVIDGITYKVTSIANNAFKGCKKLKSVTIGANVEKIGSSAFSGCTSLTKITIPKNVTTIGAKAFNGCSKLKTITIKSTALKKVGSKAFKGINAKAKIKVPKAKLKAYTKLLKKKGQASTVKITK